MAKLLVEFMKRPASRCNTPLYILRCRYLSAGSELDEDPGKQFTINGNAISFDLHPYEIKTFRLRLTAPSRPLCPLWLWF